MIRLTPIAADQMKEIIADKQDSGKIMLRVGIEGFG